MATSGIGGGNAPQQEPLGLFGKLGASIKKVMKKGASQKPKETAQTAANKTQNAFQKTQTKAQTGNPEARLHSKVTWTKAELKAKASDQEPKTAQEFIGVEVKKYLMPFLTGRATPNQNREPLVTQLKAELDKKFPDHNMTSGRIETIAFECYLKEAVHGVTQLLKAPIYPARAVEHSEFAVHPDSEKDYVTFRESFKTAIQKDFTRNFRESINVDSAINDQLWKEFTSYKPTPHLASARADVAREKRMTTHDNLLLSLKSALRETPLDEKRIVELAKKSKELPVKTDQEKDAKADFDYELMKDLNANSYKFSFDTIKTLVESKSINPAHVNLDGIIGGNRLDVLKLLLDNGNKGYGALSTAVKSNKLEIVEELFTRGYKIHPPISYSVESGRELRDAFRLDDPEKAMFKLLVDKGINKRNIESFLYSDSIPNDVKTHLKEKQRDNNW